MHAFASAGRLNGNNHEVDLAELRLVDGRLSGTITVLYHDDRYNHLRPDGQALAASYTLDGQLSPSGLSGTYSGQIGVAWSRSAAVTGSLGPETWPGILALVGSQVNQAVNGEGDGE